MTKPAIGYIGFGDMGRAMVMKMLADGVALSVWGRDPAKLADAVAAGAVLADSAADLMRRCDLVITCVTDTEAVEAVVFGSGGLAEGADPAKLLVDCSTIHPLRSRGMAARLLDETGMRWVDAPVSGGSRAASRGEVIVLAGGEAADVEKVRAALAPVSSKLTHMGPSGSGQAAKTCNQMIIGGTVAVVAEALNFASRFGVSVSDMPDALSGGWADSSVLRDHARRMIEAQFISTNTARIMQKDIDIACDMGRLTDSPMPVTALVSTLYRMVIANGHADAGQIGLIKLYTDEPLDKP
jgi:3-hydroxyisobutyrate dehydrogenase